MARRNDIRQNAGREKNSITLDDKDYTVLSLLNDFEIAARNRGPFDLPQNPIRSRNLLARLTKKFDDSAKLGLPDILRKLENLGLIEVFQTFTQERTNLGENNYKITSEGQKLLQERPKEVPIIRTNNAPTIP